MIAVIFSPYKLLHLNYNILAANQVPNPLRNRNTTYLCNHDDIEVLDLNFAPKTVVAIHLNVCRHKIPCS